MAETKLPCPPSLPSFIVAQCGDLRGSSRGPDTGKGDKPLLVSRQVPAGLGIRLLAKAISSPFVVASSPQWDRGAAGGLASCLPDSFKDVITVPGAEVPLSQCQHVLSCVWFFSPNSPLALGQSVSRL